MTTWTTIPTTQIDQDSRVTEVVLEAMRDNPIAMVEGASGAPKLALKSLSGSFSTGSQDFNGIGAWSGVWFSCSAHNASGSSGSAISFYATDDGGATYFVGVTLYVLPLSSSVQIVGFFDFTTGLVHGTYMGTGTAGAFSQTMAGASAAIDGVRFLGDTDITAGVMIHPNGGESAT